MGLEFLPPVAFVAFLLLAAILLTGTVFGAVLLWSAPRGQSRRDGDDTKVLVR